MNGKKAKHLKRIYSQHLRNQAIENGFSYFEAKQATPTKEALRKFRKLINQLPQPKQKAMGI